MSANSAQEEYERRVRLWEEEEDDDREQGHLNQDFDGGGKVKEKKMSLKILQFQTWESPIDHGRISWKVQAYQNKKIH